MMAEATERRHRWCADLGLKEVYKDGLAEDYHDVLEKIRAAESKEAAE